MTDVACQWYATHGFHPTFYYETLWNLVGFGSVWFGGRRFTHWLWDGDIFFLYLIWYAAGRCWVEMFRPDAWRMGTLATDQWFALAGIGQGVTGLLFNHFHCLDVPDQLALHSTMQQQTLTDYPYALHEFFKVGCYPNGVNR